MPTAGVYGNYLSWFLRHLLTARVVRAKKRGREAIPPATPSHPHHLYPTPTQGGAKPLPLGREATHTVRGGTPPFASFFPISIPKCQQIWMKLGRKHLWSKPNKLIGRFCNAPPGGRAIGGRRCKFDSFFDFAWISVITRAPLGGKRPPKEAVGSLDHV